MIELTLEQAHANLVRHIDEGRLKPGAWYGRGGDGRDIAVEGRRP
jgi:hypothetical protein